MKPSARLQTVIELVAAVFRTPKPADSVISAFFRGRRYIGSKDRSAIAEQTYALLRAHARLGWWCEKAGMTNDPRSQALVWMMLNGTLREVVAELCSGGQYAPEPLSQIEFKALGQLAGRTLDHPDMPEAIRLECPEWAEEKLRASLGDHFAEEMLALLDSAALDIRINPLKGDREAIQKKLEEAEIFSAPTPYSPFGLRVKGRPALASSALFQDGVVEIQDEGSQLLALMVDAKAGHQVVDFCAGAGGKTLAIAAMMNNKGRVIACDVLERRLKRAAERFRRAGLFNIETRPLSSERDPWVKRHKEKFDRVLVDAPCSGVGVWRRNPDARWRVLGPSLDELVALQREILDSAARLVKPGGKLIYATCSLLNEENDQQIDHFLSTHPDFVLVPYEGVSISDRFLKLTPAKHHTDGFFGAAMVRQAKDHNHA